MIRAENAALRGVDNYVMKAETMGITTVSYFEKASEVKLSNGQTAYVMRNVPLTQASQNGTQSGSFADASPEELERAADDVAAAGVQMQKGMDQEMKSAGLPPGMGDMLMGAPDDEPWLSANPSDMTGMYATMLNGAAEGKRQQDADAKADPKQWSKDLDALKARSRIVGSETVDGKKTLVIESKGAVPAPRVDGTDFEVEKVRMWVDAAKYVPLRMRIEGTMRQGKETRPIVIERNDQDYRLVPGCKGMYEPFRSVMKMSGTLSPEEEAELKEAQAKLVELDRKMAELPPEQQEMMNRQMGPQRKMLESLASGGGVEIETRLLEVRCNAGPPSPQEVRQASVAGAVGTTPLPGSQTAAPPVVAPRTAGRAAATAPASSSMTPAQEACLKQRMAAAEAAQKRKRGLGRLVSVVSKTAGRAGVQEVGEAASEAQDADATAQDLKAAARELGVTQDDIAACESAK